MLARFALCDTLNGVDAAYYALWKSKLSEGTGGSSSVSVVPEPAAWLLALFCSVALGGCRRQPR